MNSLRWQIKRMICMVIVLTSVQIFAMESRKNSMTYEHIAHKNDYLRLKNRIIEQITADLHAENEKHPISPVHVPVIQTKARLHGFNKTTGKAILLVKGSYLYDTCDYYGDYSPQGKYRINHTVPVIISESLYCQLRYVPENIVSCCLS